jgi:hypothetical protein
MMRVGFAAALVTFAGAVVLIGRLVEWVGL